ncbi:MAG: PP2C family protein-serine/threonine phosphatase, partial [Bryobacteraceae bacterium]
REFSTEDLSLLTVMANVAAIRIEHARLAEVEQAERVMARDMEQAALIQRGLLPEAPPSIAGFDLAGHNVSCRTVGGDYYDFLAYPDGSVAIIIADVAGKGMPAALLMSSLQARVQVILEAPGDLAGRVAKLNRSVSSNIPGNRFITFFAGVLDPRAGTLTYCNAGHNPPLVVRRGGEVEKLEEGGMILGILPLSTYRESACRLEEGDVVVFYSDGVSEAAVPDSDDDFGEERLAALIAANRNRPAAEIVAEVMDAVSAFTAGNPAADDMTVVVLRRISH